MNTHFPKYRHYYPFFQEIEITETQFNFNMYKTACGVLKWSTTKGELDEVDCPQCRESWEYIEDCIDHECG